jgi:hypothetical protein
MAPLLGCLTTCPNFDGGSQKAIRIIDFIQETREELSTTPFSAPCSKRIGSPENSCGNQGVNSLYVSSSCSMVF